MEVFFIIDMKIASCLFSPILLSVAAFLSQSIVSFSVAMKIQLPVNLLRRDPRMVLECISLCCF